MKTNKYHIAYSRLLLIIFVVGQMVLFGHQHKVGASMGKVRALSQQTATEKCQLCDAMQHNNMVLQQHVYFAPAVTANYVYTPVTYNFVSIALILSAGRSPPFVS